MAFKNRSEHSDGEELYKITSQHEVQQFTEDRTNNDSPDQLNPSNDERSIFGTGISSPNRFSFMQSITVNELSTHAVELLITKRTWAASRSNLKPTFQVGVYAGTMFVGKKLTSNNVQLNDYIKRRRREEQNVLSYNIGLDLSVQYKRWTLSSGIDYNRQGEAVDYSPKFTQWITTRTSVVDSTDNSYWTLNTNTFGVLTVENYWSVEDTVITYWNESSSSFVTDTISYNVYQTGGLDSMYFTTVDSVYTEQIDTTHNVTESTSQQEVADPTQKGTRSTVTYSYVEVPIMIGYEFPLKRWSLSVRTGVGLGILTQQKVTYLKTDLSGTEEVTRAQTRQFMWNYLLRVGVRTHLTERLLLNIEPTARVNLTSVLKTSDFSQKYWHIGGNIGLVYRL